LILPVLIFLPYLNDIKYRLKNKHFLPKPNENSSKNRTKSFLSSNKNKRKENRFHSNLYILYPQGGATSKTNDSKKTNRGNHSLNMRFSSFSFFCLFCFIFIKVYVSNSSSSALVDNHLYSLHSFVLTEQTNHRRVRLVYVDLFLVLIIYYHHRLSL